MDFNTHSFEPVLLVSFNLTYPSENTDMLSSSSEEKPELSAYEQERLLRIQENQRLLNHLMSDVTVSSCVLSPLHVWVIESDLLLQKSEQHTVGKETGGSKVGWL